MPRAVPEWPSLQGQLALAIRLYGEDGLGHVSDWLKLQIERIDNPDFAQLFSDHIDLPGISPMDYAHRHVRSERGSLIGGIRFYGQDIERPFVEVIAHDFKSWDTLAAAVSAEWKAFSPLCLRMRVLPGERLATGAQLDASVYAARYSEMRGSDGRVRLEAFGNPKMAMEVVEARYEALERENASLRRNIFPIDQGHLLELWDAGRLHAIAVPEHKVVGLIAASPGEIDWIKGDEMIEEVIAVEHSGRGFAVSAQAGLAALNEKSAETLLIGTIDHLNIASRLTAERAGRKRVMDYVFVPLV